jgi:hypothetical protein
VAVKEHFLAEPFWGQDETLDAFVSHPGNEWIQGEKYAIDQTIGPLQRTGMVLDQTLKIHMLLGFWSLSGPAGAERYASSIPSSLMEMIRAPLPPIARHVASDGRTQAHLVLAVE